MRHLITLILALVATNAFADACNEERLTYFEEGDLPNAQRYIACLESALASVERRASAPTAPRIGTPKPGNPQGREILEALMGLKRTYGLSAANLQELANSIEDFGPEWRQTQTLDRGALESFQGRDLDAILNGGQMPNFGQ